MTIWRPRLAGKTGPKYRQICNCIAEDIASGSLAIGDKLPVQRDLAYDLGLSLNTITRAYKEATDRGFLIGETGRGTYVRQAGALEPRMVPSGMARPDSGPIDFSLNLPAPGNADNLLARSLAELASEKSLAGFLDYQKDGDDARHTKAAASWLAKTGLEARAENILTTTGAQHGLLIALLATMRPGDILLTETLTYAPIRSLARHLGLKIVPVAMDRGGLSPSALDEICSKVAASVLYCLPTLHTPTTITMDAERREAIAAVAKKHDLLILEDDVFGFLPPERPLPLANFAPQQTIYITSVSKCLAPGLRVGYLNAPEKYRAALRAAMSLSCWMPPPLMAEIASRWIESGDAERLNNFQRTEAIARQKLAQQILPKAQLTSQPEGFHLWLGLKPQWHPENFCRQAEQRGVKLLAGKSFTIDQTITPRAVRLCLSHEVSRARVSKGLKILADLLNEPADSDALVI